MGRLSREEIDHLIIDRVGLNTEEKRLLTLGLTCAIGPPPDHLLVPEINSFFDGLLDWYSATFSRAVKNPGSTPATLPSLLQHARHESLRAISTPQTCNISPQEKQILSTLRSRKDIVIKKADKGASIVIWPTEEYIKEATRQLDDTTTFEPVANGDEAVQAAHTQTIRLLAEAKSMNVISAATLDRESEREIKIGNIYFLPKVHKPLHPTTGSYKGRPIVSCCSGPTRTLDLLLTRIFTPLLTKLPERLRDTTSFLLHLHRIQHRPTSSLFSLDIESLYPSIPQAEAVDAMINFLSEHKDHVQRRLAEKGKFPKLPPFFWLHDALHHVLRSNVFHFNGKYYRQIKGTCMGASISVALAEIFVHMTIERSPARLQVCPTWKRYIDDILVISPDPLEPDKILECLNRIHPSIRFTIETSSDNTLPFLDTLLYLDKEGRLQTRVYYKSTDRHLYLHQRSFHPRSCKKSLPYSQGLRIIRNTSDPVVCEQELDRLLDFFKKRSYPASTLAQCRENLDHSNRLALIMSQAGADRGGTLWPPRENQRKPFPLIFHPRLAASVNQSLHRLHATLEQEYRDLPGFPGTTTPMIAWKRNKNIKDHLVRSEFPPPHQ